MCQLEIDGKKIEMTIGSVPSINIIDESTLALDLNDNRKQSRVYACGADTPLHVLVYSLYNKLSVFQNCYNYSVGFMCVNYINFNFLSFKKFNGS